MLFSNYRTMPIFCRLFAFIISINCLYLISCKEKTGNQSVVGKWIYKELRYTSDNPSYRHLNDEQRKQKIKEEDQQNKGSIIQFNEDKTFIIIPGGNTEDLIKGSYEIKKHRLTMQPVGDKNSQTASFSFPEKTQ